MCGQDHRIEILGPALFRGNDYALRVALHGDDRRIQANAVRKGPNDGFDVAYRAPLHRLPLRVATHGQEAVIIEEVDDELRRELPKPLGRCRPDGRPHGNQIVIDELPAVAVPVQVLAQLQIVVLALQQFERLAVESNHVKEHSVKRRTQEISALGEQSVQGTALVFQPGLVAAHAEAHIAIPRRDVQLLEQADEVRIGSIVEDHEARIGGVLAPERLERDGVRVPAHVVVGLENVDVVVGGK